MGLHAGHITRLARHIEAVLDPDGDPERAAKARRSRGLTITNLGCGQHRISGTPTDETAALLNAAIAPLAAPRPAVPALRGRTQVPRGGPHLHVTAAIESLRGDAGHPFARTATGEDLDLATLRRLACDAGITPIVANPLGEPLAVGRESRVATRDGLHHTPPNAEPEAGRHPGGVRAGPN